MLDSIDRNTKISLLYAMIVMTILLLEVKMNTYFLLALVASAYLLVSYKIIIRAFKTLFSRFRMSEQFLMTIATFGALALQDYAEAIAIIVFYQIGEIFEDYAQGKSHKEITSVIALKPNNVRLIDADGNETIVKPRKVPIGSKIRVLAGELVAIDGVLLSNNASLDMSALTGESEPYAYKKGDVIASGGVNQGSVIEIETTVKSKDSSINRLIHLIEDASLYKSKPEALISRFSVYYTPIVVSIAAMLALTPLFIADASAKDWIERALVFLVLSCPCALVLSVPLSFFGGLGAISKTGVMVKGSIFIESLAHADAIAFDKTGTITHGKFDVNEVVKLQKEDLVLPLIYSLESLTTHPIGTAIVKYCKNNNINAVELTDVHEISGCGITAKYQGLDVALGKKDFIEEKINNKISIEKDYIATEIYLALDGELLGYITLSDKEKEEAKSLISTLKKLNIKTYMISGDKKEVALDIANRVGIDECFYQMLPDQKLERIKELKTKHKKLCYVGDGINDAPSLAASDVGIAMGQFGSASAVEASDVVIMNDDINKVAIAIELSKKTLSLALSNMVLVLAVKLLILVLGAFGLANIWLAILGDVGLCVIAVLNAMRALTWAKKYI